MGRSWGKIDLQKICWQDMNNLYEFLQGKYCPGGLTQKAQPHLTADEAFSVIYYLQEIMEVLPDEYEACRECGCLYDTSCGGTVINEQTTVINGDGEEVPGNFPEEQWGTYCEDCRPD